MPRLSNDELLDAVKTELSGEPLLLEGEEALQAFIHLTKLAPGSSQDITGSELYRYFLAWCEKTQCKPYRHPAFFMNLRNAGFKRRRTYRHKHEQQFYLLAQRSARTIREWLDAHPLPPDQGLLLIGGTKPHMPSKRLQELRAKGILP